MNTHQLDELCCRRAANSGLHAVAAAVLALARSVDGATRELMLMGRGTVYEKGCLESAAGEIGRIADALEGTHIDLTEIRLLSEDTEGQICSLLAALAGRGSQ